MEPMKILANYYRQFDADYTLDVPAEGFGGWAKDEIEINKERTALVVMHSMGYGSLESNPGVWRSTEFIPRTYEIDRNVFSILLPSVRKAGMTIFHVVGGSGFFEDLPGYKRAVQLAGRPPETPESLPEDEITSAMQQFRSNYAWRGKHNNQSVNTSLTPDFLENSRPIGSEGVAENAHQLFALCKDANVNHLIYTGFCIDWCLLMAPGCMLDMFRLGLMCSTIRQAITAVENKETARQELVKEIGLWRVALMFGFVFDLEDLLFALDAPGHRKIR